MTKARQLADLGNAYDDGALSNRNLIINGGLLCWQRGISHSSGGGIVYTADRFWKYSPSVSGTYERSTDAPDGFAYSMHYNVNGSTAGSGTTVEFSRQGYFPQGQYTISFYVKGDLTNTDLGIGFRNSVGSGTDQVNFSPITNYGNYTDWTRVVRTFTINLAPHANNKFLNLEFAGMPAGVKFTGIQLEVGDTATPFEHRSYGDELAKCQRYYYMLASGLDKSLPTGSYYASDLVTTTVQFPVAMRSAPTLDSPSGSEYYGIYTDNGFDGFNNFTSTGRSQIMGITVDSNGSGASGTVGFSGPMKTNNANAYVAFDAEL